MSATAWRRNCFKGFVKVGEDNMMSLIWLNIWLCVVWLKRIHVAGAQLCCSIATAIQIFDSHKPSLSLWFLNHYLIKITCYIIYLSKKKNFLHYKNCCICWLYGQILAKQEQSTASATGVGNYLGDKDDKVIHRVTYQKKVIHRVFFPLSVDSSGAYFYTFHTGYWYHCDIQRYFWCYSN